MSVIACEVYDDRIELAADSIRVRGWSQRTDGKSTKLARVRDVVVGGAGLASENGGMQLFLQSHRPVRPDVESILVFLGEFADWKRSRTGDAKIENQYIFAFDGHAYTTHDYFVDEITTYEAIGAGEDHASAAMHLGHTPTQAVQVAIDLGVYCEGPIVTESIPRRPSCSRPEGATP